jgi:acyl-coenzyme A thioesterase PaaI-like protein
MPEKGNSQVIMLRYCSSGEYMTDWNAFTGFHERQAPMTDEESRRAGEADRLRSAIEELLRLKDINFLDRSPVVGGINAIAAPMSIVIEDDDGATVVVGRVTFGAAYEGPPGCVHGGIVALYFDELLGVTQSTSGNPGMTANLSLDFHAPTPLGVPLVFRGRIDGREGRKIFTRGTLHYGDVLCASAEALFISMRPEVFERILQAREQ